MMHWSLYVDLLTTCLLVSTGAVDLFARTNGAVHFYLPPFRTCGEYTLTNPRYHDVINVKNASYAEVNDLYQYRSNYHVLDNGTVLYTLHHLTPNNDDGLYDLKATSRCQTVYTLTVLTDFSGQEPAFWSTWGPWSECSISCGRQGQKTRHRNCSHGDRCNHGTGIETDTCMSIPCPTHDPPLGQWNDWAQWSLCSRPCETGTRQRQRSCSTSVSGEICDGQNIEQQRCDVTICSTQNGASNSWSPWTDWGECSRTCETGTRSRARNCVDEYRRPVQDEHCVGEPIERTRCDAGSCGVDGVGSDDQTGSSSEHVLSLPISVVIATGASLLVLILVVVIILLLVRLRKRGRQNRKQDQQKSKAVGAINNQLRNKKQFNNDVPIDRVMSSHTYAEIDDDSDFDTDFDRPLSQLTIDNTYSAMPRSPKQSVDQGRPSSVKYLNIPCHSQKVKGEDTGRQKDARVDVGRQKCTYYNSSNINHRQYPTDSAGYAVPLGALR